MPGRRNDWKKDVLPPHNLPLETFPERRKDLPPWMRGQANADLSTGGRICFCRCRHNPFCELCLTSRHQRQPGERPLFAQRPVARSF